MRTYSAGPNLVPLDFDPDNLVLIKRSLAGTLRRFGAIFL